MVDSTIIIGLLVLLTLNSISTPFVEEEQSAFFTKWYETQQEIRTIDRIIVECNSLLLNPFNNDGYDSFRKLQKVTVQDIEEDSDSGRAETVSTDKIIQKHETKIIGEWHESHTNATKTKCFAQTSEKLEKIQYLGELNRWGHEFNYLDKNMTLPKPIENKSEYLIVNSEDEKFHWMESQYHQKLASGPLITIITNIAMIFPFLISAIVDSIFGSRKKDSEASKAGVGLMVAGLVGMIIGMVIIGNSFWEASSPFIHDEFLGLFG